MKGLDYDLVEALDLVIQKGGFDKAADALYISQSAISQRIKQLEKQFAAPVLVREKPPRATELGQKLLGLYRRVRLLESEAFPQHLQSDTGPRPTISIAINADSLATWLLPAVDDFMRTAPVNLDLIVTDELRTLERMRKGEVAGAISLDANPIAGCESHWLGRMDYLCVCNPQFANQYFANGVNSESLMAAPTVLFDYHDQLNQRFYQDHFDLKSEPNRVHHVASSEAFVHLAKHGVGYCLIPEVQIENELKHGTLVDITPGLALSHQLYWHHWQVEGKVFRQLSQDIMNYAKQVLPQV